MKAPERISLTPTEQELINQIAFDDHYSHEKLESSCEAASKLARSLLGRGAVPKLRLRYFIDPELNIGGRGKSRKDVFERNGTKGEAIFAHGHFLKYLQYFIYGPDLPASTIAEFQKIVEADLGSSGMVLDDLRKLARSETRRLPRLDKPQASDEFFKLALESGLDTHEATSIRDAAQAASRRT